MSQILSFAVTVASKGTDWLVGLVPRCGYVCFTDRKVSQLDDELEELVNTGRKVGHDVKEAGNDMKRIEPDVEKWVEYEQIVANTARSVLDYCGRAQKTSFCGWLPNPKARYRLGKDASVTVEEIQKLIARRNTWKKIYYENAPPGLVEVAPEGNSSAADGGCTITGSRASFFRDIMEDLGDDKLKVIGVYGPGGVGNSSAADGGCTITGSRASIFQDIMEALGDDKLKVIGVYGPGGVGKTTLLREVKEKLRKERRPFGTIIKAEVSRNPDLNNIQGQIADALSLNLKDKQSPQGRRDLLLERLQRDPNEKILIILDDLWKELDLEAVGIPNGDESRGCKLLLTSRYKDVLEQMHADRTFRLEGLTNDEAFRLFEKKVGDKLKDVEELKEIATPVVEKLAGLPLLITSVASPFLKYSDAPAWRNALIKIEESNVETIVKLAYDHLKNEDAKSLFLLCGLISGTIEVEILLVLGMGLGLFEGFDKTMEDARDRLDNMLNELRSACLLLDGGDDKGNVTIHDLYSEVVVSTPLRGQNSLIMNNNSLSKEKLEKCWAICLMDVGSDRLAELMRCGFPNLKILMMTQSPRDERDCYRLDFTYMKELRVLYLRSMHITTLPSSIEILRNLQSLCLDHCDVDDVTILGKLKALQILSLARSKISKLPKEIGELTNLRSLNLRGCGLLKIIEPGVLEGLINLEELLMLDSCNLWIGNDELVELKSLTKLSALEIIIRDPNILLEAGDLPFGNLTRFWINIGNVEGREFEVLRTMKLDLEGCDGILSQEWVQKTLHKTEYLHLKGLGGSKENAHELCTQGFPQLKHLNIENSPSIEYIASSSSGIPLTAFMRLESLLLANLVNLKKVCHGPIAPKCLSKLKDLNIRDCNRLKYLWCHSQMQSFVRLEEIEVRRCESMQAIVTAVDDKVELPNVRSLYLCYLPRMTSFCIEAGITLEGAPIQVSFPRLESLVTVGLFELEKILYTQAPLQYANLKSIVIYDSTSSSSSILKLDWVLKLPNLESLEIENCHSTKVVFDLEELKVTGHVEILPKLTELTLSELPNLQHLWKHDGKLQGLSVSRNLKKLDVKDTGLAFLLPISVAKCLGEITDIEVEDCRNMEAVIVDEEGRDGGTDDIIEFPKLKQLHIWQCPTKKFFSCPSGKKELVTTISDSQDANSDSFFDQKVKLPNIRNLRIEGAQCKELWNNQIPSDSFCKLKDVNIRGCNRLKYLWCLSQMQRFVHLEEIEVTGCHSMQAIVIGDGREGMVGDDIVELSNVRHLTLGDLPRMTSFAIGAGITLEGAPIQVSFPRLESLRMDGLLNLNLNLDLEKILCRQPPLQYTNLKSIGIRNFASSASSILKSDLILKLPNLESLDIENCHSTKVVFDLEDLQVTGHVEILPQLTQLILWHLPDLHRIWKQDIKLQELSAFRNLKTLRVVDTGLAFLFTVSVAKCLREITDIEVIDCRNMEAVIVDEEGRDGGTYDIIEFPKLKRLCIWNCPTKKFFSCPSGLVTTTSDSQDAYSESFFDRKVSLPSLEALWFDSVGSLERIWHGELPKSSFCELATLTLDKCSELLNIFPSTIIGRLHKLERVELSECPSLESLFDCRSLDSNTEQTRVLLPKLKGVIVKSCPSLKSLFDCRSLDSNTEQTIVLLPKLEELTVYGAEKLSHVVKSDSQMVLGFPSLTNVLVENCSDLSYLFPYLTATTLEKLKLLNISNCEQMKEVVPKEEGGQSKVEEISFPSLTYLSIRQCRDFGAVIASPLSAKRPLGETAEEDDEPPQPLFNEMVTFPNLRKLKVGDVQCKELWSNQIPNDSFCNLESLKLEHCNNLQRIAPSHMWERLQRCLKILKVSSCHSIKIIYETNGTDTRSSELRSLYLYCLENLRHIWQYDGLPNIPFPKLRFIEARRCSHLEMLFPTFTAEFLRQIERLVVGSCEDMKLIAGREECEEATGTTITFSKLKALGLYNLSKFRGYLPEKYPVKFPSLEVLRRVSCGTEPDQSFGESKEESVEESEEDDGED